MKLLVIMGDRLVSLPNLALDLLLLLENALTLGIGQPPAWRKDTRWQLDPMFAYFENLSGPPVRIALEHLKHSITEGARVVNGFLTLFIPFIDLKFLFVKSPANVTV